MAISTAVDLSAVARVVGIKTTYRDLREGGILFLPQRVAVVGQGSTSAVYDTAKRRVTSASEAATIYGHGSPIHLSVLQLLPVNGDGVGTIPVTVYPLVDDVTGVAAAGSITATVAPTEPAAYRVSVNGILSAQFVIADGDTPATVAEKMTTAINSILDMPVVAATETVNTNLTAKWKGTSGNAIKVSVIGSTTSGNTFAITQLTGGLVNPDVQPALDQVGDVWETMVLNTLDIDDEVALDAYQTFGEGRWGALTKKPLIVFTGNTATSVTAATAISDTRKDDRVNSPLVAPGSDELPLVVAARELASIVRVANNNPARDYGSLAVTGIEPGTDGEQWTYIDRDAAVKLGSSTIEVKDGVIHLSDTVTFYHPTTEPIPAYRYVCDIVKLQNIIFNLNLIFANPEWDGAPLIPDDQPTVNREAKKPKMAVAEVAAMIDSLGLNAIISDPETAKKNTRAEINAQNPKRLDLLTTLQLVGNANIISVDLDFGFYFGQPTVVA